MPREVAIRLGTTGKAQVKADVVEIGDTGEAQAKRWARAWENADRDVAAAQQRAATARKKYEGLAPGGLNPTKLDNFAGVNDNIGKSAAASADVFNASYRQMEIRAQALVSAIDPVYAAQQRFDREMVNAKTLLDAGVLSADRYSQVEKRLTSDLQQVTVAHGKAGAASGAHRAAMQGLSYQVQDTFTQLSMGANALQVLAIQGGQAAGQMTGMGGALGKVAQFMIGPWGLALTGGALLLGSLTKGMFDNEEATKKAEAGLQAFGSRQSDIGNFIDTTTGKLKEQNKTLVLNAILTRQAQIADNNKQIAESRGKAFDRASSAILRGTRAAPGSTTSGVSFTDDTDVQRVIRDAAGDVTKLSDGLSRLARTRPELAKVALDVSGIGGQAILAQRDNQKLGVELRALNGDTTALVNRDTSLIKARAKLAGATSTTTRAQAAYTIAVKQADAAYAASNKTQADQDRLLAARTAAERTLANAQDGARAATRAASEGRRDLAKAEREAAQTAKEHARDLEALQDRFDPVAAAARKYREELTKLAGLSLDPAKAALFGEGLRKEYVKARADAFDLPTIEDYRPAGVAEDKRVADEEEKAKRRADFIKQTIAGQEDSTALTERDLQLVRVNDQLRDAEMAKLRLILDLKAEGVDATSADGVKILANADRYETLVQKLREQQDVWKEVTSIGGNAIDRLFDPNSADSWGDRVKGVLGDLKAEFIKLALLNPLKNMLFGEKNATLSSVIGNVGKLFGKNAAGTEYWSGGMSLVGENGPEIVSMPRGSRVTTAGETRQLFARNDNAPAPALHFDLRGAVMTEDLLAQMNAMATGAAIQGANGGRQMAGADIQARASRRLGRY